MTTDDLQSAIAQRNRAFEMLDMNYARAMLPNSSDEVRLVALHKSRYECCQISDDLRRESEAWLKRRGFSRFKGQPWPADGSLPQ